MKYIRYPKTDNNSLRAWNASDELLVRHASEIDNIDDKDVLIINDRFGYLRHNISASKIVNFIELKSQLDSIAHNNNLDKDDHSLISDESILPTSDVILISVPKSLVLFEHYMRIALHSLNKGGLVLVGFMTKYFTKALIKIGSRYFNDLKQSLAVKKARVLQLRNKINITPELHTTTIEWEGNTFLQNSGVFSDQRIDIATQFLLETIKNSDLKGKMLDLGCGNGIIGWSLLTRNLASEVHFMDDFLPALSSASKNISDLEATFHWEYKLDNFETEYFDLIISNPPFHFGFEIDFSIPFNLIKNGSRILKKNGRIIIVGNKHINYGKALKSHFNQIDLVAENDKFIVWIFHK